MLTLPDEAPTPFIQSFPNTLASAIPPAGDATEPTSSYARGPGPVARHNQTPRELCASSALAVATALKLPLADTGVVPQPTEAMIGNAVLSIVAVHPPAKAPHA